MSTDDWILALELGPRDTGIWSIAEWPSAVDTSSPSLQDEPPKTVNGALRGIWHSNDAVTGADAEKLGTIAIEKRVWSFS